MCSNVLVNWYQKKYMHAFIRLLATVFLSAGLLVLWAGVVPTEQAKPQQLL
jgi:hypothetical protein